MFVHLSVCLCVCLCVILFHPIPRLSLSLVLLIHVYQVTLEMISLILQEMLEAAEQASKALYLLSVASVLGCFHQTHCIFVHIK